MARCSLISYISLLLVFICAISIIYSSAADTYLYFQCIVDYLDIIYYVNAICFYYIITLIERLTIHKS